MLFISYLDQGHIGTLTDAAGDVWKYYYDADGKRRIKSKTVAGVSSITDNCSYYFYEGEDLICQQDIGALVQDESQYEPKFLLLDHLGSTRAELVFTESGGVFSPVIQEYYDLMPYGEVIDPPTSQESVLFTGKQRDAETGYDYFGPRNFNFHNMRWLSADSPLVDNHINEPQFWNLYSYVGNNPAKYLDPSGRQSKNVNEKKELKTQETNQESREQKEEKKIESTVLDRIVMGVCGGLNIYIGVGKIGATIATSESGVGAAYFGVSAAGNITAGTAQLIEGTILGNTDSAQKNASKITNVTTISGYATTLLTNDDQMATYCALVEGNMTGLWGMYKSVSGEIPKFSSFLFNMLSNQNDLFNARKTDNVDQEQNNN